MATALLFPGQGSQFVGMGHEFAKASAGAREVFDTVDEALGQKLSSLMWEGPSETLTLTENAQPALMATSLACLRFLEAELGEASVWSGVALAAGHSLGEYSALTAAGAFSIADSARLLRLRGQSMQAAVAPGAGAMAAIIGLEREAIDQVIAKVAGQGICDLANDNGGGQIVISGDKAAVESAADLAKEAGAKRAILLEVSAPFHSRLMQSAGEIMREALGEAAINKPRVPVLANVTTELTDDPDQIRQNLTQQVVGSVRWAESMAKLGGLGVDKAFELGAGKVLTGLMRRIDKGVAMSPVGGPEDITNFST